MAVIVISCTVLNSLLTHGDQSSCFWKATWKGRAGREEESEEKMSLVITEVDGILLIPKALEAGSGCCNVVYEEVVLFCKAQIGG